MNKTIMDVVIETQEQFTREVDFNRENPPKDRPEQKFHLKDKVGVRGWGSVSQIGVVTDVDWIYHPRLARYTWGYLIEFSEGYRNPLTFSYIPEGYIELQ